jgi:regulator-associated protein of mTOR
MRFSVWDWSKKRQLASFHNGNPKGATITSAQFINQDVGGLILVASGLDASFFRSWLLSYLAYKADGMIRLYRNYDPATSDTPVQMVSAFRGLNDIIRIQRGSGTVINWKQAGGFLHISGDTRIIRVWDAHTETQLLVSFPAL